MPLPEPRQAPSRVVEVACTFASLVDGGLGHLPLPGSGGTLRRWDALAALAADDLCVARLAEAHLDALAVLVELDGPQPPAGSRWGFWASRPPQPVVSAMPDGGAWRLTGTKPWCSGARACTHALVTAEAPDGYRLFAVDLAEARPVLGTWPAVGMSGSDSLDVDLTGATAVAVGAPGAYLERPGFWHGAIAVAACWHGGATGLARALLEAAARRPLGPHALGHLGAVDAALSACRSSLREAAAAVDADPLADQQQRAARVRAQVERAATEVLHRVGRALGASPLSRNARHSALAADLPVYLRQSHAETDLAVLGELALQGDPGVVTIDVAAGTPERLWQTWPRLAALPVLDLTGCSRAVVVAPHPDDEVLAVGGVLALLLAAGAEVELVSVTDGEASHPGSAMRTPEQLRAIRRTEVVQAVAALGGALGRHDLLAVPDGEVAGREAALADDLAARLRPGDWCLAPYERDGHPDHDAAGRAAATAVRSTGARLLSYPLWTWHWAVPGDPRVAWDRAHRVPLSPLARRRKRAGLACYPSQTAPLGPAPQDAAVVPPGVLAHFLRPDEVLLA